MEARERVALVSDIHGNAIALRAVLRAIRREGVDEIICLGDVATLGVAPCEVVETLAGLGCRCVLGNHDEYLLSPERIREHTRLPLVLDAVDWCRDQLGRADLAFVAGFEAGFERELAGGHRLRAFHGSPRCNMTNLLAGTPAEELDRELAGERASVLAGGHTHLQLLRQHRGAWLVNPGSVGAPFREFTNGSPPTILDHAEYAVVEVRGRELGVALRRVGLDRAELHAAALATPGPVRAILADAYR